MSKTLELLEELKKSHYVDGRLPLFAKCRFDKIEQELKEGEENKQMLNIIKNALSYEVKSNIPFAEDFTKDSVDCFIKTIAEIKTHELDDELKKVLREWVLKNAFPKELKALEIIREIGFYEIDYMLCVGYDTYRESRDKPIEKEKYDLLKEVLS